MDRYTAIVACVAILSASAISVVGQLNPVVGQNVSDQVNTFLNLATIVLIGINVRSNGQHK